METEMPEDQAVTGRKERLEWCKRRALEYVDNNQLASAFSSFISDLGQDESTELIHRNVVSFGIPLFMSGCLDTPEKMRKHIEGYN